MSMEKARKVLSINVQFEISERKASERRIMHAYEKAVAVASEAVREELLEGSISGVRAEMSYGYQMIAASRSDSSGVPLTRSEDGTLMEAAADVSVPLAI